jgi:hypothetical protein
LTLKDKAARFGLDISRQPVSTGRSLNKQISTSKHPCTISVHQAPAKLATSKSHIRSYLLSLLEELQYVEQSPLFHPEGDTLYHSIQVYQCAKFETNDPELLAAALFHDVGKAIDYPKHDQAGSDAIDGLLSPRITWLIRHHLDLLETPQKTRRLLAGTKQLVELEKLRRWDLAGRQPDTYVISSQQAIDQLFVDFPTISCLSSSQSCYK